MYDPHSGLHKISWKIFDNFTGEEVVHGQAYESPQGDAEVRIILIEF